MASHSSILAWKIPWTAEPGRLQSMGSLRVRHDRYELYEIIIFYQLLATSFKVVFLKYRTTYKNNKKTPNPQNTILLIMIVYYLINIELNYSNRDLTFNTVCENTYMYARGLPK